MRERGRREEGGVGEHPRVLWLLLAPGVGAGFR